MSDIRYENGKIYKIVDNTNGNIYIGSTINSLSYRLSGHKTKYKSYLEGKCHNTRSFDIIKNNNYRIELLENYPCNNKKELETRERDYIEDNNCLNKAIPTRTDKEYRKYYEEKRKQNYINNRDKILERSKQNYINNRDKKLEYGKQYRIKNLDKKLEYGKQYRIKNRDKIKENRKINITCECGSIITKVHINRHKKTKKHLKFILIK